VFGNRVVEPPFECRHEYWWLSRVAAKLGWPRSSPKARQSRDWLREIVAEAKDKDPDFPAYEELSRLGVYRKDPEEYVAFSEEIHDPSGHPFKTPSGKIEIFSTTLYEMDHCPTRFRLFPGTFRRGKGRRSAASQIPAAVHRPAREAAHTLDI